MQPYQDKTLSPVARARDLCSRLTLGEKVGQLNQRLYGFNSYIINGDELVPSEEFIQEVRRFGGLGTLYGLYRADPWSKRNFETGLVGKLAIKAYNLLQSYVIRNSRFQIPMLVSSECPHGHQALYGYLLPVNLAAAATFQPDLLQKAGEVCGRQLRELGVNLALVSMLDILRDPRWGRSEECYGEDPFLASQFAKAIIQGIQSQGVAVVAKHFCAQGETTGGINASAARIGPRELREIHLPAAKAACEAGVIVIMAAYNEIDGIPCHMNGTLLNGILRNEYGFEGAIMADGCAIDRLDMLTGDNVLSGALAIKAGIDQSLWDTAFSRLEMAVEKGYIQEEAIDQAVIRVLTLKFKQGLFEHPYLPEETELASFDYATYPQSFQIAKESIVLLKNDGVLPLPLKADKTIALIGPAADDVYRQLGDYSPPVRKADCYTLLDGVRAVAGQDFKNVKIFYDDGSDLQSAAALASHCDVTILALGGSSSRFQGAGFDINGAAVASGGHMDCGEGMDSALLTLPDKQHELFARVRSTSKKVITILIAGRPYAVADIARDTDALLISFYPGPWGGLAIAQAVFGLFSLCGRLPVSFPVHAGQIPVYYNQKAGLTPLNYCDQACLNKPVFSFGDGFGYSKITYSGIILNPLFVPADTLPVDETPLLALSMLATNSGEYDESAVPLLFVTDLEADVVRRVIELKAFHKIMVPAGESKNITLILHACDLAVWNQNMRLELQRGAFLFRLCDGGKQVWQDTWVL
jgi:beta-glucosidase